MLSGAGWVLTESGRAESGVLSGVGWVLMASGRAPSGVLSGALSGVGWVLAASVSGREASGVGPPESGVGAASGVGPESGVGEFPYGLWLLPPV